MSDYKYEILTGTQIIQHFQYKCVCIIHTQNSNLNGHPKLSFSRLLRHTWLKAVMLLLLSSHSLYHGGGGGFDLPALLRVPKSSTNFVNINTRLWNVLLVNIDVNVSISTFKHNLKTYLLHHTVELKYPR